MVREFSIIFIKVRKKSRKTNYLVIISFYLTIGMVVRNEGQSTTTKVYEIINLMGLFCD